jgi:hypothetical protein
MSSSIENQYRSSHFSYVIDASRGVPKVITDGTHAPPISVKIVGEPHFTNINGLFHNDISRTSASQSQSVRIIMLDDFQY